MKFLISLAWKNLSRYKKRTIITASAIAFGLMMFIVVDSMLYGGEVESERNLVWYETASAQIQHKEYFDESDKLPLEYVIDNPETLIDELHKSGYKATTRTQFKGEIFMHEDPWPQDGSIYIRGNAIDLASSEDVFDLEPHVIKGRWLQEGDEGIVLGSWLAEDINAEIGFPLTIRTRTRYGAYVTIDTTVVGIVQVPNPIVNRVTLYMTREFADYNLEMDGAVTEVDISFPWNQNLKEVVSDIKTGLNGLGSEYAIKTWKDIASDYVAMATMKRSGSSSILFLVFIIAAVGISNTMLMAVFERTRELGMMRSLGMKDSQIRTSFLIEAGGIGFIGGILGIVLGALAAWPIIDIGLDFSFMLRDMDVGYRILGVFKGAWKASTFPTAFVGAVLMAMSAAYIPTRRALKMRITDCLRDE